MLHLLTSQVSFLHTCKSTQFNDNESNLKAADLDETNFTLNSDSSEWLKFCSSTYSATEWATEETDKPLLSRVDKLMPHWTPEGSDKVVYATVNEAHSGSADDVSSYLFELRTDLHIGEAGYPKYVLLGGDQQTYAIMKILKYKYPEQYDWLFLYLGTGTL